MKKIYTLILAAASLWMSSAPEAKAQSGCPQIVTGAVLTAAQWNNCFARKQDYLGYVPLNPSNLVAVSPITLTSAGGIISLGFDSAATSFVFGPVSSTDNAIARFDGTTGKLIQNSNAILGDSGALTLSVPANTGLSITDTTVTGLLTPNTLLTHSFALGTASSHPLAFYTAGALAGYFGIDGSFTVTPQATSSAHGLTIYQTGITSGALPAIQSFCQNQGGAYYAYNEYCVTDRASVATLGIMPPNPSTLGVAIGMDTGGVNSDWNKVALNVTLQHIVASNAANLRDNVALGVGAASYASEGGTDTAGGAKGTLFGIGCGARLKSGATNYFLLTCAEIASAIETGASTRYRWGMAVANTGDLQSADIDAGIAMGSGGGLGFKYGLFFTNIFGTTTGPVTLCLICDDGNTPTIANGFLSSYHFTGDFINLRSGVFKVADSGAITIHVSGTSPLNITSGVNTGASFTDGTVAGTLSPNSLLTHSFALGSTTNHPLVFYTNNTLAGYFDTSQNLNVVAALNMNGSSSGVISIKATSGTINFNLPITAGTPGQVLTSQGGGSTAMTWSTVATSTLTSAHIFVGNGSNVATDVALSGDATLANTGAMTIANNAVTFAKMQTIGANTIMGNPTAGSLIPSALSAPSCSTSASALIYITNTGFNCNSSIAAASAPVSGLTGAGTGVLTALAINVGTAGALVVLNGALGSPSSAGTIPAFTLGGDIAGSGNHINNVIIGNTGPQAAVFTALEADNAVFFKGLTVAAGTPNSICQNSATKEVTVNAALTCTVSSAMFKHNILTVDLSASDHIMAMRPVSFSYNDSERDRLGFIAEELAGIDRRLADGWDGDGNPRSIDQNAILAQLVKNAQEIMVRLTTLETKH